MILFLILSLVTAGALTLATFFARELLYKFEFLRELARTSDRAKMWHYDGTRKPGMYNLVLRGDTLFSGVIAFDLHLPFGYSGLDPFGYVSSDTSGVAVIGLYLGRTPADFTFLANTSGAIVISCTDADQLLTPQTTYLPHFWQRMGIFG